MNITGAFASAALSNRSSAGESWSLFRASNGAFDTSFYDSSSSHGVISQLDYALKKESAIVFDASKSWTGEK